MSPLIWLRVGSLAVFALATGVWDVRARRVPNALAVSGLAAGLALAAAGGWPELAGSLAGAAAYGGPLLLCWLWGLVGAGDAKAGFAFGALLGMPWAMGGLLWGVLAGLALAAGFSGAALLRSVGELRAARRQGGWSGAAALVATHPAWSVGIPYATALAAGSVWAVALSRWRL